MIRLSLVIPAYNEQARLPSTLEAIIRYFGQTNDSWEVLVVDDGSADSTASLVEEVHQRCPPVRLIRNPGNRGKGFAVRNGMLQAKGAWVLFSDADLSTPIAECANLLAKAEERKATIAIGSRRLNRKLIAVRQPFFREYSGRAFNLFMRLATGLKFRDTQCGFKLYRADAARAVFSRQLLDGFSFDVEDLVIAKVCGFPVVEVPVRWSNAEGSKVSMRQGLISFLDVVRIRWNVLQGRYSK